MSRSLSSNGLPRARVSIRSRVRMSKGRWNFSSSSICHCSTRRARGDDEAALERAADEELADEQPGHDRLAGARVVGEQEAQRLAREHLLVDRGDLVRQRLDRGAW